MVQTKQASTQQTTESKDLQRRQEWTLQTGLAFANGLLDLILKTSVLLLVLPALAILTYLRTIHRTDLFLPAVTSAPGLFALLEATFILCAVLLASFVAPSWIASQIADTYGKTERPTHGSAGFVMFSGVVSGLFFLTLAHLLDAAWPTWLKWSVGILLALLIPVVLFLLAWHGPRGFRTLTDAERADRKLRIKKSVKRTLWVCGAALLTLSTFVTFDNLFPLYGLTGNGWRVWAVGTSVFPATLLPAGMYLARRSWDDSQAKAVTTSATMLALTVFVLVLNGVSPVPLALLTMRAMSIAEKEPRTFELVTKTERAAYQALGFHFIRNSDFFKAAIRFQFGDVRLICVDPYDIAGPNSAALGPLGNGRKAQTPLPETGCVTPLKDETRVVEPPATGLVASMEKGASQAPYPPQDKPVETRAP
ncbi:MFS transporter [Burkholderia pseudomallei]|uniref:MFS transporter n=1 Tax=Burkholderia pseudomallei TaxID=28450 RepID=UPI00201A388E|nr:MFS transporter [Burkholderia pseudomallei]MCL4670384.1 MFS transporter [Burkholderia pseudomallei]